MDFTLKIYRKLLETLIEAGYEFVTFKDFLGKKQETGKKQQVNVNEIKGQLNFIDHRSPFIILRHDVDRLPGNALGTAQMEHELGIRGSYYFRVVPESWNAEIIKQIAALGHEVGYHYEDVHLAARVVPRHALIQGRLLRTRFSRPRNDSFISEHNGKLYVTAINLFEKHLERLRRLVPVETVCMHGSPRSKYDSRDLWKKYDYRDYGVIGEPYFDVDFTKVLYLTDTGRRWNGSRVSVRDKEFNHRGKNTGGTERLLSGDYDFRSTFDIIRAAEEGRLPQQIMITVHPQRWSDEWGLWVKELIWQNVKNLIKWMLMKMNRY